MAEPLATAFIQLNTKTGSLYDAVAADFDRIERRAKETGQRVGHALHGGVSQGVTAGGGVTGVFQTILHPVQALFHRQGQQAGQAFHSGFRQSSQGMGGGGGGGSMFGGGIMGMVMGNLTTAGIAAAGTAVGALFWKGFTRSADIEDAKASMKALGYDAQVVEQTMGKTGDVMKIVTGTAFSFSDAVTIATSALASGLKPGEQLSSFMQMTADAAGFAHVGIGRMGEVLTKVQAQGKLFADDLNQLATMNVPGWQWAADKMGMDQGDLREYMRKGGTVSATTFFSALQEKSKGMAQEMGKTVRGSLGNFVTGIGRLGATLMEPFWGDFPSLLGKGTDALDAFGKKAKPVIEGIAKWFKGTLLPAAKEVIAHFATTWREVWPKIEEKAGPLMARLKETWERVKPVVQALGVVIIWLADKIIQSIPYVMEFATRFYEAFNKLYDWVKNSFWPTMVKVWEAITGAVGKAWDFLSDKFTTIKSGYNDLIKTFEEGKQKGLNALDWLFGPTINFDQNGILQTNAGGVAMQGYSTPMGGSGGTLAPASHLTPGASAARQMISQRFGISDIGGWRQNDAYPDHPSGRALDVMIPGSNTPQGKALGDQVLQWVMQNKNALGVDYAIWRQNYIPANSTSPTSRTGAPSLMEPRGSATANHMDHVHITLNGQAPLFGAAPSGMTFQTSAGGIALTSGGTSLVSPGGSGSAGGVPGLSGTLGIPGAGGGSVAGATDSGWIWGVPRKSPAGGILSWVEENWNALQAWNNGDNFNGLFPDTSGAGHTGASGREHRGLPPLPGKPGAPGLGPLGDLPNFADLFPGGADGGGGPADMSSLLPGVLGGSAGAGLGGGGSSMQLTGQKGLAQMLFGDSFMSLFDIIGNMFRESLGVPMMFSDPSQWGTFKAISGLLGFGSSLVPSPEAFLKLAGVSPEMMGGAGGGDPAKAAKAQDKLVDLQNRKAILEQRLSEQQAKGDKVAQSTLMSTQDQLRRVNDDIAQQQAVVGQFGGGAGSWGPAGGVGGGPLSVQDAINTANGLGFLKQGLAFGANAVGGNFSGAASALMGMPFGLGPVQVGSPGLAPGSSYTAFAPAGSSGVLPVGAVPDIPLGQWANPAAGGAPVGGGGGDVTIDNSVNVGQGGVVGSVNEAVDQAKRPGMAAQRTNRVPILPGQG